MSGTKTKSAASTSGHSGNPLSQKLGLKPALRVRLRNAPTAYWEWCAFDAASVDTVSRTTDVFDFGHLFVTARDGLDREIAALAKAMDANGMLWISWPKRSSGMETDVTEDTLREVVLPLGLVDVKVCAVTEVWSGLKFVRRLKMRGPRAENRNPAALDFQPSALNRRFPAIE